jgi:hypothetical protein
LPQKQMTIFQMKKGHAYSRQVAENADFIFFFLPMYFSREYKLAENSLKIFFWPDSGASYL